MNSTLFFAFLFLVILLLSIVFLIREVVPPVRTLGVEQKEDVSTWEHSFKAITPDFVLHSPAPDSPKKRYDLSGNVI